MSDMIGLLRFGMPVVAGGQAMPVGPVAAKSSATIPSVGASSGGSQASANRYASPRPLFSPQFTRQNQTDAPPPRSSVVIELPAPFDPDVLTGPPPTFEATLLQLEAHLRMSLARIDASRNARPMAPHPAHEQAPPSEVVSARPASVPSSAAGDIDAPASDETLPGGISAVPRPAMPEPAMTRTDQPRSAARGHDGDLPASGAAGTDRRGSHGESATVAVAARPRGGYQFTANAAFFATSA